MINEINSYSDRPSKKIEAEFEWKSDSYHDRWNEKKHYSVPRESKKSWLI